MIINMKSSTGCIYDMIVSLLNILQTIITGVICLIFILCNSIWEFTEELYNNDFVYSPTDSPKPLILI